MGMAVKPPNEGSDRGVRKIVAADLPRGRSEARATSMLVTGDANESAINALVCDVGLSDATRHRFRPPGE